MALKRILIVDDARDVGRMYQQALRSAYPHVQTTYVPSAEEAMLETVTYTVDLMVVDIRLPGMSGFDLVRRVRTRQPEVKVIMITGLSLDGEVERESREVQAARLLSKPISVAEFLDAVKETLGEEIAEAAQDSARAQKAEGKTAPLPQPPPEPAGPAVSAETESGLSLSASLSGLRGSLGAQTALLLDDNGRVTARAGHWPADDLIDQLVPNLMAGLSTTQKISRQLGAAIPDAVQGLRGPDFDLLAAPVGRYMLLIFLKREPGALRLALAFEEALLAQKQLARILGEMGLNILPILTPSEQAPTPEGVEEAEPLVTQPVEEEVEPPTVGLKALEEILDQPTGAPSSQDAQAFWDNLDVDETPAPDNPDVLTYEQARKLGLLPDEE